jgi:hypothetical protein
MTRRRAPWPLRYKPIDEAYDDTSTAVEKVPDGGI